VPTHRSDRSPYLSRRTAVTGLTAVVVPGLLSVGTGGGALADRSDPVSPVPIYATVPLHELTDQSIPPSPVIPLINRGIYVSSVAIPGDLIVPSGT
jgi:hypothetical protein